MRKLTAGPVFLACFAGVLSGQYIFFEPLLKYNDKVKLAKDQSEATGVPIAEILSREDSK